MRDALALQSPTLPAPPIPGEGCPTPLAWPEVLAAFRAQRDEYALPTSWGTVTVWEFGAGPPLVCLGGATGDAELFALTAWLLREDARCIFVCYPVAPPATPVEQRLPGWSLLVQQALTARGYSSVDMLATGFGGLLALQTAVDAPALVHSLVLVGCVPQRDWRWRERLLLRLGQHSDRPLGRWPLWNRVVESNHRRWFPPFDGDRWEFLRDNLAATLTRRFVQCMQAWLQPGVAARLGEVRCPTLLVRSEGEGRLTAVGQELLATGLHDARVESLHSAGHFPHVTHPHRLVKLLREWRTELPLRPIPGSE